MKIKCFIKQVVTIAIGCLLSITFLLAIIAFGWSLIFSRNDNKKYEIKPNSILELNLEGMVVDYPPSPSLFRYPPSPSIVDLKLVKQAIYGAKEDNRIKAIYLNLSFLRSGWATLEEIREALLAFKQAGKHIVAYGDDYTHSSYYLASVANEIILNPAGIFVFKGFSITRQFYTNLLEKIHVKPIIFKKGKYKSWSEPYFLHKMSPEERTQSTEFLSYFYEHFLAGISQSRMIPVSQLKEYAHNLSVVTSSDALNANLITKIAYESEARELLRKGEQEAIQSIQVKEERGNQPIDSAAPVFINYKTYRPLKKINALDAKNKIAVVVAEGEIVRRYSSYGQVGGEDFVKMLKKVQEDPSIKAVVLRINSPGGDMFASDIMTKAVTNLRKAKPVVASMSDMAASAGYSIAAPCNYIFAQPTTTTGSIGCFAIWPDISKLMDKIGIEQDVVKTAPSADFLEPRLAPTPTEAACVDRWMQQGYDDFLRVVSQGRGIPLEQLEKLAGGRVYSGVEAQKNGLVDMLGGVEAAIEKAAFLASLPKVNAVCYFPRPRTKWEELVHCLEGNKEIGGGALTVAKKYPILASLISYYSGNQPKGIQAILPYPIEIE